LNSEKKAAMRCFREALKLDAYYSEIWSDLGKIIIKDGLAEKALPYLQHAYKVTGDVPGINYLLASFFLHTGNAEKAYKHLSSAISMEKEIFNEFLELLPKELMTKKIKKLLESNDLLY
jgi:tetratricopeptide (TPR) repeat protein